SPYEVLGINLTALMTFLLICSSVTMVKGLEWLGKGDRSKCKMFLFFTALGGAIFVSLQAYEWTHLIHRGLHINGNPWGASLFGTTFFLVTGFHGLHVTGGVIYLLAILRYVANRPEPRASYNAVEIVGLYWHFVDLRFETRTLGMVAITPLAIATLLVFLLLPDGFAVAKRTTGAKAAVSAPAKP